SWARSISMKSRRTVDSLTPSSSATAETLRRLVEDSRVSTWSQRALRSLGGVLGRSPRGARFSSEPELCTVTQPVLRVLPRLAGRPRRRLQIDGSREVTFESRVLFGIG